MKKIIFLFITVLLISCNELKNNTSIIEEEKDTVVQLTEAITEEMLPETVYQDTTSHLDIYKVKLEDYKYQYDVTVDSSYWYRNTKNGFTYFKNESDTTFSKIRTRLKTLDKYLTGRNAIFLNSKINMQGNFKPRGRVIEYIFKNDATAHSTYDALMQIKKTLPRDWEITVDWKCPAIMILKDNHIYHIITGGHYMLGMEKEIAGVMFE